MQAKKLFGLTICLVKAGLTGLSGAATTFATGVALVGGILGKAVSRVALAGAVTPTVDGVTGLAITVKAGFGTVVVWAVDAAGTVFALQGTTEAIDPSGNFQQAPPQFPAVPDNLMPFAYSVHKGGGAGSAVPLVGVFTFGVSNWNTIGMTHTATDIITLPDRPQSA